MLVSRMKKRLAKLRVSAAHLGRKLGPGKVRKRPEAFGLQEKFCEQSFWNETWRKRNGRLGRERGTRETNRRTTNIKRATFCRASGSKQQSRE
jgi:hypothetical protein